MHVSRAIDEFVADLADRCAAQNENALAAVAAAHEGYDQNPAKGTIMTHDTPSTRWPVARRDGYDEVTIEDEEHGLRAFVSHNDGEDYWRLEVAFQNLDAYYSCKEDQVAAARLMQRAAECLLELNGEQVAA